MSRDAHTPITTQLASTRDAVQPPANVVLTCTSCGRTYEPTVEDFAAGRTECPDPACPSWTFWAQLVEPGAAQTHRSGDGGRSWERS